MTSTQISLLSVSELTLAIKNCLEPNFSFVRVKGEVTNLRHQSSGHIYFSLKDHHSQISAVLFQGYAKQLSKIPKPGDQVVIEGGISLYAPRGSYQIIVKKIEYEGVGELLLALHRLKEELSKLGWFHQEHKKKLPPFPKKIGVITSPSGAVIQDILNVLNRRHRGFHLILCPVNVQGKGSELQIAKAIEDCNKHKIADVLIVGRGGGSLEDLWCFNERCVAKAIYDSKIPIVSAVGHETDTCIADLVADVRAPTPSAAAELVMAEKDALLNKMQKGHDFLMHVVSQKLKHHRALLHRFITHPLLSSPYALLGPSIQKRDEIVSSLDQTMRATIEKKGLQILALKKHLSSMRPKNRIDINRERLNKAAESLLIILKQIEEKRLKLSYIKEHLAALHPNNVLMKGYCIPFHEKKDSVIMSASEVEVGQGVSLLFFDGKLTTEVKQVSKEHNEPAANI